MTFPYFLRAFVTVFISACLLALLSACESRQLTQLSAGDTILAFGDSLTEGKGVSEAQSYPAVLEEISGFRVVNAGISGEITAQGLQRLPSVLDQVRPSLMLLMHGGNDILQNLAKTQAERNLSAMIEMAHARGIEVVLIGVPEKKLFSDAAPYYEALAKQYSLVFEESLIADLLRSPSKKSDAVHFNQAGYREIAQTLLNTLKRSGAV